MSIYPQQPHSGVAPWPTPTARRRATLKKIAKGFAISDLIAIVALVVSIISLGVSIWQSVVTSNNTRIERANAAVQHFLSSKDMMEIADEILRETKQGTDYSKVLSDNSLKSKVNHYLNHLETIAEGVNQERYDEQVVFNNLAVIIFKVTKAHLRGESGTTPTGQSWITNSRNEPPFPSGNQFPELRRLYEKWFPTNSYKSYSN